MSDSYIREAIGAVNGSNVTFFVPEPFAPATPGMYITGTITAFLNGLACEDTIEIDPATGEFELPDPPRTGDQVLALFSIDTGEAEVVTLEKIFGVIKVETNFLGELESEAVLSGQLAPGGTLVGTIEPEPELDGIVEAEQKFFGQVTC